MSLKPFSPSRAQDPKRDQKFLAGEAEAGFVALMARLILAQLGAGGSQRFALSPFPGEGPARFCPTSPGVPAMGLSTRSGVRTGSAAGAGTNPPLPAHLKDNPAGADLAQFAPSRSVILRIQPLQLPSSSSSPGLKVGQAPVPCWSFDFSLPCSLGPSPALCQALWDG